MKFTGPIKYTLEEMCEAHIQMTALLSQYPNPSKVEAALLFVLRHQLASRKDTIFTFTGENDHNGLYFGAMQELLDAPLDTIIELTGDQEAAATMHVLWFFCINAFNGRWKRNNFPEYQSCILAAFGHMRAIAPLALKDTPHPSTWRNDPAVTYGKNYVDVKCLIKDIAPTDKWDRRQKSFGVFCDGRD